MTPADALVLKTEKFADVISKALAETDGSSKIVTVGINPTRPETGYGYICSTSTEQDRVVKVEEFKEKPNLETAKKYVAACNYFWNAGIFVWNVNTIEEELRTHSPQICSVMDELSPALYSGNEDKELARLFPSCEKISIDYAVMEKSADVYMIPGLWDWSDLGSFEAIEAITGKKLK